MSFNREKGLMARAKPAVMLGTAMLLALSGPAFAAGESGITTVERMAMASNLGDYVLIRANNTPVTLGCTTDTTWHFALDISTGWGKGAYAMLMEARATGRRVWLSGSGLCSGGVELVRSLTTYD